MPSTSGSGMSSIACTILIMCATLIFIAPATKGMYDDSPYFIHYNSSSVFRIFNGTGESIPGYEARRAALNVTDPDMVVPFQSKDIDDDASADWYYAMDDYAFETRGENKDNITSPPNGLVSWYPLDNNSAWDPISGYNGTLNGGVTTGATGQVHGAYDFDGSDDYISTGKNNLIGTSDYSIVAWFKAPSSEDGQIFGSYVSDVGDSQYTGIRFRGLSGTSDPDFRFYMNDDHSDQSNWDVYNHGWDDNTWHHVVVVVDRSSSDPVLYIDSISQAWDSTDTMLTGDIDMSGNDYQIGSLDLGDRALWGGLIDDVRIYDRALTANEVEVIYNSSHPSIAAEWSDELINATPPNITITEPTDSATLTDSYTCIKALYEQDETIAGDVVVYTRIADQEWEVIMNETNVSSGTTLSYLKTGLVPDIPYKTYATARTDDYNVSSSVITFTYEEDAGASGNNTLASSECPTTNASVILLASILFAAFALIAISPRVPVFALFAALLLMFSGFVIVGCSRAIGGIMLGFSIVLIIWSVTKAYS